MLMNLNVLKYLEWFKILCLTNAALYAYIWVLEFCIFLDLVLWFHNLQFYSPYLILHKISILTTLVVQIVAIAAL